MSTVTTWTWEITRMATMPNVPNQPDYVVMARWTLTGSDGTNTASVQGSTHFDVVENQADYVAYSSLTHDQVVGWVQATLGTDRVTQFEATVQKQIDAIENPPVVPSLKSLPWSS